MSGRLLLPRRDVRQAAVPGKYNVRRRERDVCVRPGLRWRQCHGLCCVWGWQVCSNAGMLDRQGCGQRNTSGVGRRHLLWRLLMRQHRDSSVQRPRGLFLRTCTVRQRLSRLPRRHILH